MTAATCEGDVYIHNLATFVRNHERQLANALAAYKKPVKGAPQASKPVRLSLTLHHLYYLLERFQELGMSVGPLNIRLDNIDNPDTPVNYVSFLSEFHRNKAISSDAQSIHSISSVKSVMSTVSALWSVMGNSEHKKDTISQDLKYLYSAFTKLPCLRIAPDLKAKLIEGHEEYPFDTTVPIKIFRKLSVLEISEIDPKEVYGWNYLSEGVKFLVVKKANIADPAEILVDLVDDDMSKRDAEEDEEEVAAISSPKLASQSTFPYYSHHHHHHHHHLSLSTSSPSYSQHLHQPPNQVFSGSLPDSSSRPKSVYTVEEFDTRHRSGSALSTNRRMRTSLYYTPSSNRRLTRSDSTTTASSSSSSTSPTAAESSLSTSQATLTVTEEQKASSDTRWKGLRHLSLSENRISHVSPWSFDTLVNLSSLDLSNNRLTAVPEAIAKLGNLKSLNLSANRLTSTKGFPKGLSKLTVLNLRYNNIENLESLEHLMGLEKLDLRHNKIAEVANMRSLFLRNKNSLHLLMLFLTDNPIVDKRGYRVELFNLFNAIDPSHPIKIDGSRPGLFESRLLLDQKGAHANLVKFLDEPMINQITENISTMGLKIEPQQLPPIRTDSEAVLQSNQNIVNTTPTTEPIPVLPPIKTFLNPPTNISISALLNPMDPVDSSNENASPTLLMPAAKSKAATPAITTPVSTPVAASFVEETTV